MKESTLSYKDVRTLAELWLSQWHANPERYEGGNTEAWYNVVLQFQANRGDEIIPGSIRNREFALMQAGRSQEYAAALKDVLETKHVRSEYELAILVLTANAEEREAALLKVGA